MGFGSVDGYQRAFRREFGVNPKEYSTSPIPVWLFTPSFELDHKYNKQEMPLHLNVFMDEM